MTNKFFAAKNIVYGILLLVFLLAILINNYIWLSLDRCPFTYDAHRHFMFSLKVFNEYRRFSLQTFPNIFFLPQRQSTLVGMITAPFYFIFGITQDAGTMINAAIFCSILLISVYFIGAKIMGPAAGLLSAFIVMMYPIIFNHLKTYNLDLPLTAMVALSTLLLLLSEHFTRLNYSLLFFLSCVLGSLTKDSFLIYIIAPATVSIFYFIVTKRRNKTLLSGKARGPYFLKKIKIIYLITIILAAFFFAMAYFLHNRGFFLFRKFYFAEYRTFYPLSWELPKLHPILIFCFRRARSLFWYFWAFVNWQISFLFLFVFFFSLFLIKKAQFRIKARPVLISTLAGFLFVSFLRGAYGEHAIWMGARLTMPILPFAAIISAAGILTINNIVLKRLTICCLIMLGLLQYLVICYGTKLLPQDITLSLENRLPPTIQKYRFFPAEIIFFKQVWPAYGGPLSRPNQEMEGKIIIPEEIFKIIDDSNGPGGKINIVVIPDISRIWAYLEYRSFIKHKPYIISGDWVYFFVNNPNIAREQAYSRYRIFVKNKSYINSGKKYYFWGSRFFEVKNKFSIHDSILKDSDYIIDKYEGELGEYYRRDFVLGLHNKFESTYKGKYQLLRILKWPDGADICIYKKRKQAGNKKDNFAAG